jgi:hypothetical protein
MSWIDLAPEGAADPGRLVERTEALLASRSPANWHRYVLGVGYYRAGRYEEAA